MFKKVLIAEDHESSGISVLKTLIDLEITDTHFVYYCDDAMERVKRSVLDHTPFDLLITDLSFDEDHRPQTIKDGAQLVSEVRKLLPEITTLIFSIEKKAGKIDRLFKEFHIDGYVGKGRGDARELKKAILSLDENKKYLSLENKYNISKNTIELSSTELTILQLLSEGILQKNIPQHLQGKGLKSTSLSFVEKTISSLKDTFRANSSEHLIAQCKDLGII